MVLTSQGLEWRDPEIHTNEFTLTVGLGMRLRFQFAHVCAERNTTTHYTTSSGSQKMT